MKTTNSAAKRPLKSMLLALAIPVLALSLGLAGCSSNSSSSGDEPIGGDIIAPVTVESGEVSGGTFDLLVGQVLNVNAEDPANWTGSAADPAIAEFTPGSDDGSAQANPGFTGVGVGTTDAKLTSPDGETHQFTITVK